MMILERPPMFAETAQNRGPCVPSRLSLKFTPEDNATRMFILAQEPPWRAIRAFRNSQGQALVHLHNVSGGILSGDALHLSIDATPGARVQVTSVGATKLYRARTDGSTARLLTSIRIGEGAMLEYLPDAIIPFRGSRTSQSTTIWMGRNAGFIGWEMIAAGRVARDELFGFESFRSECGIHTENRPLALERYSLNPAERDPESAARWGRFRYTATLYVCHTGVAQSRWLELESRLNRLAMESTSPSARWGVSALIADGLVVRGLALEAHQITTGLQTFWGQAKQEIWGEPAVPPRKIN